jgi:hypothetical protein
LNEQYQRQVQGSIQTWLFVCLFSKDQSQLRIPIRVFSFSFKKKKIQFCGWQLIIRKRILPNLATGQRGNQSKKN